MMGKRNAHAMAARGRKAGAHKVRPFITCDECGRDMGHGSPSHLCAPCTLGIKPDEDMGLQSQYDDEEYYADRDERVSRTRTKPDCCPVCEKPLTGCGVWNVIIGEVCSITCLENYWEDKR